MVTDRQRKLVQLLVRFKIWTLFSHMRCINIRPRKGTVWLFRWLLKNQVVDNLKHAPCCPANHWHKQRLVFQRCTCGAASASPDIVDAMAFMMQGYKSYESKGGE